MHTAQTVGTVVLLDISLVDESVNNGKVYDVDTTQDGYLTGLLKEHGQLEPVQVFIRGERYVTHKVENTRIVTH